MKTSIAILLFTATVPLVAAQRYQDFPSSNVAGKKLINISQTLIYMDRYTDITDIPELAQIWQQTGYDGIAISLTIDPCVSGPAPNATNDAYNYCTIFRWWDVDRRSMKEFERDIRILKSVEWGRLTDNFLWTATAVVGRKAPNWFSDEDWDIVLANAELSTRIAKEIGFKGIVFDAEGYGVSTPGTWRNPWNYHAYAQGGYKAEDLDAPRSFVDVYQKVQQRAKQWAQTISKAYPDMVLAVLPGLYEATWPRVLASRFENKLEKCDVGLWPAFIDGMLMGLGEEVALVAFCENTYLKSQFSDFTAIRSHAREQALVVSGVPDLARQRIGFAAGIWTDAGFGSPRFSTTDVRVNQRDPQRHKHATHNALAASDHYAWHWGEWGVDGESNFLTAEPTPLMKEYWQANIDAHQPMNLEWKPTPYVDRTDYARENRNAAQEEPAFWEKLRDQRYQVVMDLPEFWKFQLDTEMLSRYGNQWSEDYDDNHWSLIKTTQCWQSQGYYANAPGLYRVTFAVPAEMNSKKQEILLAFSAFGSGAGHVYFNGQWVNHLARTIDVSDYIKPGQDNILGIVFLNKQGPGGLMGHVKLLAREKDRQE